jgi:CubicO group peptidase (beta-lactamase class C family)
MVWQTVLENFLKAEISTGNTSGGVIAFGRNARIELIVVDGFLDVAKRTPMREDAIFRIYSMTKPLTGIAICRLAEMGKLQLSDDIGRFFDRDATGITVRHLLTHTSGITGATLDRGDDLYRKRGILPFENTSEQRFTTSSLARELVDVPLAFAPGARWAYGRSFDVLGYIAELAADASLADIFAELFVRRLGLDALGFNVERASYDRVVTPWSSNGAAPIGLSNEPPRLYSAGSGAYGTALDYFRTISALTDDTEGLLSKEMRDALTSNQIAGLENGSDDYIPGDGYGYGYGVAVQRDRPAGLGAFWWLGRAATSFYAVPEGRIVAVAMLQNYGNARKLQRRFRQAVEESLGLAGERG